MNFNPREDTFMSGVAVGIAGIAIAVAIVGITIIILLK